MALTEAEELELLELEEQERMAPTAPMMDQVAGQAVKAAVMPLTAPGAMMTGEAPQDMPDPAMVRPIAEAGKKSWETLGIPEQGLKGAASMSQDFFQAMRHGEMPEGENWKTSLQKGANVVQGTQAPPKVAGAIAGLLDWRGLALGEALNPVVKGLATTYAAKAGPAADWLAERVLQYSKRMVGNNFARGMADEATEFANVAHPEIQQAIMDVEQVIPKARAAEKVAEQVGGKDLPVSESTVKPPVKDPLAMAGPPPSGSVSRPPATPQLNAPLPVQPTGAKTGDPHALFDYTDNFGPDGAKRNVYQIFGDPEKLHRDTPWGDHLPADKLRDVPITGRTARSLKFDPTATGTEGVSYTPGSIPVGPEGGLGAKAIIPEKNPYLPPGERVIPPTRLPDGTELVPGTDFTLAKPKEPKGPLGLTVQDRGVSADSPNKGIPGEAPEQGLDKFKQMGEATGSLEAPEGIESLGRPTISMGAGTDDMYAHVTEQLKVVGEAEGKVLKGLTNTGKLYDLGPVATKIEGMKHTNAVGSEISPFDYSAQGEYNAAVSKILKTLKATALDNEANIHPLSWDKANMLKGVIQGMADYSKPATDPINLLYKSAAAAVKDDIDNQAAKALALSGQDIAPFQALRKAYSNLKVLESSLNNKFAVEKSAKSAIPVLRTAGAAALMASGKHMAGFSMLADYLIRKYGPQAGAQMMRSIAENAGGIGNAAGNAARVLPPAASAVSQGFQGD